MSATTVSTIMNNVKKEIRDEYLGGTSPWVIGFSGGKDSLLMVQLVVEAMLTIPPSLRTREVHIVYNDTLVESPVFQEHVERTIKTMREGLSHLRVPTRVAITSPPLEESFWVNLLGKGYPAPNRKFRWCMDRLKIRPSKRYILDLIRDHGEVILLIGVRKAESAARSQRIEEYSRQSNYERLVPNTEIDKCMIFRPLIDVSTEAVWEYISSNPAPWGDVATKSILAIYQNAGMCNASQACALIDDVETKESSSILARFGCWTCTVIRKDRSLEALIADGYGHLQPLAEFRDRLREMSDNPEYRSNLRRNGQPGLGPLTLAARRMLLGELLDIQAATKLRLISNHEIRLIEEEWSRDKAKALRIR